MKRPTVALQGERFGRLVVAAVSGPVRTCVCDCGAEVTIRDSNNLTSGNTRSCGCLRHAKEVKVALPGERFGRLVVTGVDGTKRLCRCDCGNTLTVESTYKLKAGNTRSCGCFQREDLAKRFTVHGAARAGKRTRMYSIWLSMNSRCTNPRVHHWDRYGGRGITVCERWRRSFENFLADMGEPPDGCTLDRIDNDGPYSPENCRWATQAEQRRNTSRARLLTYQDRTQPEVEWAEELGIGVGTLRSRINRGWTVERSLTQPVRCPQHQLVPVGEVYDA